MTRDEMLDRMSAEEFSQWRAFASKEPFGEDRMDVRMAVTAAFLGNMLDGVIRHLAALGGGRKPPTNYVPKQFIHDWWDNPTERAANLLAKFKALSERINKREPDQIVKGGEIGQA